MNLIIWILTAVLLTFSFLKSTEKTISALKKAYKKLGKILPLFLQVMAGFALIITFVSPQIMQRFVGAESGIKGVAAALGIGSISVMPGFAAFPLCAALRADPVLYCSCIQYIADECRSCVVSNREEIFGNFGCSSQKRFGFECQHYRSDCG